MRNNRGEISYASTSIAIIITVLVGAVVMGVFLWIMRGPLADKVQAFGKEQEGNIIGFTNLIFETREDDPFNPADENLIPNGAIYYCVDGSELPGNGINHFPDIPKFGDQYQEGDYLYTYKEQDAYFVLGWQVKVIDTSKGQYSNLRAIIANKPLANMRETFSGCYDMKLSPSIPSSVINMDATFSGCYTLKESPVIPDGVTSMNGTFSSCSDMQTPPVIPQGVTSLQGTFYYCGSLEQAPVIPNCVTNMDGTFAYCVSLVTAPELPISVIQMNGTFAGCTALTSVNAIPKWVSCMDETFNECENLTGIIQIDANPDSYTGCFMYTEKQIVIQGDSAMLYELADTATNDNVIVGPVIYKNANGVQLDFIPETPSSGDTAEIGDYIYYYNRGSYSTYDCGTQWSVMVKDDTKSSYGRIYAWIGSEPVTHLTETFAGCSSLEYSPKLPYTATYMDNTFTGSGLKYPPVIPNNVKFMVYTFERCEALETAPAIPNGVTHLTGTFFWCTSLKKYVGGSGSSGDFSDYKIPDGVQDMTYAFNSCAITVAPKIPSTVSSLSSTFSGCAQLETAPVIPYGVKNLNNTFSDCTSLVTAPVIPNSVKDMAMTFAYCSNLTTAPVIPDGVTNLDSTFLCCTSLKSVPSISSSVENMDSTFAGCSSLVNMAIIPSSVKNMNSTFYDCSSLKGTLRVNANPTIYDCCLYNTGITDIVGSCTATTCRRLLNSRYI